MKRGGDMVNEYLLERLVEDRIKEALRCAARAARAAAASRAAATVARQPQGAEAAGDDVGRSLMARQLRWKLLC
jgi:ribosomal protein L12E/L44/L45/RPP1/RPP2